MKKLLCCLCILTLLLISTGCGEKAAHKHNLVMNDADWLYEKLPSSAEVGDAVTVKIKKAYDLGNLFLVNGEKINMEDYTDEYWQFTFTMPDRDVEIDFKTYDGFLPDANYGTLIETFWLQNPEAEYVHVREYYDEYESGAIVAMIDWCDYTDNVWSEEISGCEFIYGDGNRLQVLCGGKFYKLPEAYADGHLTDADIQTIFEQYKEAHKGAYTNEQ